MNNPKILQEKLNSLYAPPEPVHSLIRIREDLKNARQNQTYLSGFGVYSGDVAGLATLKEMYFAYGSGWTLAARLRRPDISVYSSHEMVILAREIQDAIRITRHYVWEYSGGKRNLRSPLFIADVEAGFGDVQQTFNLVYKLFAENLAVIVHLENQHPSVKVCGHQLDYSIAGKHHKEPKLLVPRDVWIKKLEAAQMAAGLASRDAGQPQPGLVLARSDSPDGVLENGIKTNLQDAIDDIIAAYEEVGILIGWVEFNNCTLEDPLLVADKILNRCPDMLGLFINVSPNLYKNPHPLRSDVLAKAGYVGQFSTIPINLIVQRAVLEFADEFKQEPFEAVLKLHERARQLKVPEMEDGIFQGQNWVGTNWWKRLKVTVDEIFSK